MKYDNYNLWMKAFINVFKSSLPNQPEKNFKPIKNKKKDNKKHLAFQSYLTRAKINFWTLVCTISVFHQLLYVKRIQNII